MIAKQNEGFRCLCSYIMFMLKAHSMLYHEATPNYSVSLTGMIIDIIKEGKKIETGYKSIFKIELWGHIFFALTSKCG